MFIFILCVCVCGRVCARRLRFGAEGEAITHRRCRASPPTPTGSKKKKKKTKAGAAGPSRAADQELEQEARRLQERLRHSADRHRQAADRMADHRSRCALPSCISIRSLLAGCCLWKVAGGGCCGQAEGGVPPWRVRFSSEVFIMHSHL